MESTPAPDGDALIASLEERVGHRFKDRTVALQALTHSSAKDRERPSNERLEFFGDAFLGLVVSEYLFRLFPACEEGELSTMKSIIVSAKTLSVCAEDLELDEMLLLGRGLTDKKSLPRSILCNAFEAVVAALYMDAGFDVARDFVLKHVMPKIGEIMTDTHEKNYKSLLQDYAQRNVSAIPQYRVLKEVGPDHKKRFQVVVELDSRTHGSAWGSNKKEAEQSAAKVALQELGLIPAESGSQEAAKSEAAGGPADLATPAS
jgi:ribonuclease-3